MAYPKHYLVSFGGSLGLEETWSCGLRMTDSQLQGVDGNTLQEAALDHVAEIDAKVRAFIVAIQGRMNGHATHHFTKFNAIDPNGHYYGTTTGEVIHAPAFDVPHGSSGPFQISTVISLATGVQRGLAVAGRFFLPTWAANVDVTGAAVDSHVTEIGEAARDFVVDLNDWNGIDLPWSPVVCVVSQGKRQPGGGYGTGMFRPVTEIGVGRIQDTQRRRRANLKERYHPVPL